MPKKDAIKEFTTLKGVNKEKAEILYNFGFKDISELKNASLQKLLAIKGISKSLAENIYFQLHLELKSKEEKLEMKKEETPKIIAKEEKKEIKKEEERKKKKETKKEKKEEVKQEQQIAQTTTQLSQQAIPQPQQIPIVKKLSKGWKIALIISLIWILVISVSLNSSWFSIEYKGNYANGVLKAKSEYCPITIKWSSEINGDVDKGTTDWSSIKGDDNVKNIYTATFWLMLISLLLSILLFVCIVLIGIKNKSLEFYKTIISKISKFIPLFIQNWGIYKIAKRIAILMVLISLITVIYFVVAMPNAVKSDFNLDGLFGSKKDNYSSNSEYTSERSWYPDIGFFLIIFAIVLTIFIVYKYRNDLGIKKFLDF